MARRALAKAVMMKTRFLILGLMALLAACGSSPAAPPTTQQLTLGLGYIPDVQFAPFYTAVREGFYAAEGLSIEFQHGPVNELLVQQAAGKLPFILASGDEVLAARAQQIPVKMVWLLYQKLPVAVFSKKAANVRTPADLHGKTIGLPGRYGATYIGLRGLLYANNMDENDVTVREIGFTQFQAVSEDKIATAVGYANNEPLRLAENDQAVDVILVADFIPLVSNGLVINESLMQQNPDLIRRFVRATARGLQRTIEKPDTAFQHALTFVPELKAEQQPLQRKVLQASLNYWHGATTDAHGLGYQDPQAWQTTYDFLRASAILTTDTDPAAAFTNDFLGEAATVPAETPVNN